MTSEKQFLSRLSVRQDICHIILLDEQDRGGNQIATEDDVGEMEIDFSDEQLIENCEMNDEDVSDLRQHRDAVIKWIKSKGFNVIVNG